jgi:hypothetical protein
VKRPPQKPMIYMYENVMIKNNKKETRTALYPK